ncbi:hypothetical protein HK100_000059, partial [Physocladia obscura]
MQSQPFATKSDGAFVRATTTEILQSAAAGDVDGLLFWVRKVNIALTLKMDLDIDLDYHPEVIDVNTQNQHVETARAALVKTLGTIAGSPGVALHVASTAAALGERLAKKESKLSPMFGDSNNSNSGILGTTNSDSESAKQQKQDEKVQKLDALWRPLWAQLRPIAFPRAKDRVFSVDSVHAQDLAKLVRQLRRFFPPDAALEILNEFLPDVNPHNNSHLQNILQYLVLFLNTTSVPTPLIDGAPSFFWTPTIFNIWSLTSGNTSIDKSLLSLVARLAFDQIATPQNCGWSEDNIDFVFSVGLKDLGLPVGSSAGINGGNKSNAIVPFFAKFVVSTIYPPKSVSPTEIEYHPPAVTLQRLGTLLQAAETYFHPSNYGPWSLKLAALLNHLANAFLKRWRLEQRPDCKTPTHLRLTVELKREFISAIANPAFLTMFSKDPRAVNEANSAIKGLAYLDDDGIVLNRVLESVYSGLETLTQTHRTQACLSNLGMTILPLINREIFPSGAKHLLPILNLALPGIDMNDPMKTTSTFVFISSAFMSVPVANVSAIVITGEESQDDIDLRLSTADFADWVILFLNRIYSLFENLPQIHGSTNNENTMEGVVVSMATYSLQIMFQQVDAEIQSLALASLAKFLSGNVIPSATKAVGRIIAIAGGAFPAAKLKYLLGPAVHTIRQELRGGASSSPSLPGNTAFPFGFASLADAAFYWHQNVFVNVMMSTGETLLGHESVVRSVIEEMILGCRSFRGCIRENLEVSSEMFGIIQVWLPDFWSQSYKKWGEQQTNNEFTVDWHIPNENELTFGISLITQYAKLCTNQLNGLIEASKATPVTASDARRQQSFEFSRWLTILNAVVSSLSGLLAPWDDLSPKSTTKLTDLAGGDPSFPEAAKPECGYLNPSHYQHSTLVQLRYDIGLLLENVAVHFEQHREDDVAPVKQLIKNVVYFISFRGVKATVLARMINGYKYIKSVVGSTESGKRLPRYLLVKKAQIQAEGLLTRLFNLSISSYSEIRIAAQNALTNTTVPFDMLKKKLLLSFLERLITPNAPEHVVKGCLHVLTSSLVQEIVKRDIKYSFLFINAICMPFGDKPSIQEMVRNIFMKYLENVSQLPIGFIPPTALQNNTAKYKLNESTVISTKTALSKQKAELFADYSQFVEAIVLRIESPTTHWRSRAMAVNLLEVSWRPEDVIPVNLVKMAISGVVSAHPTFRDVSITLLVKILRGLKARARSAGTDRTRALVQKAGLGISVDEYLKNSVSGTENRRIHDSSIIGWYCWPEKAKFYSLAGADFDVPFSGISSLPYYDAESSGALETILKTIKTAEFWAKLVSYHSQESSKDSEKFNADLCSLICTLAGQFEDLFSSHLKTIVMELVKETKEKSKQRAAAEILAGLIRGSKNWSEPKRVQLWGWIMPLLEVAFQNAGAETSGFWIEFLVHVSTTIGIFKWRLVSLYPHLLTDLFKLVTHPYQQVRDNLGSVIEESMDFLWYPSAVSVLDIMKTNINSLAGDESVKIFALSSSPHPAVQELVSKLFSEMDVWRKIPRANNVAPSKYANASKTVIAWLLFSLSRHSTASKFKYLEYQIPEVFKMIEYDDADLQKTASGIAVLYGHMSVPKWLLPRAINQILQALAPDSELKWQAKLKVIPVLQILFFRNVLQLSSEMKALIMDTVSGLLEDPQVEIRNIAGVTLSGLVRCSERASISSLTAKFEKILKSTKAAKKKSTLPARQDSPDSPNGTRLHPLIVKRHAAVIGLSSLVLAFPYDIPSWMPEVLITLSSCISDQAP